MKKIFKKKNLGNDNSITKYLNSKLTTNNFREELNLREYFSGQSISNQSLEYNTNNEMTCCSLGLEQCVHFSDFCSWDSIGYFCRAANENASNCTPEDVCCGGLISELSQNNNQNDYQIRSLSNSITPDQVFPNDGVNLSNSTWFKETSNWILRGNKNLNNNPTPIPCAVPPTYNYSQDSFSCPRQLEKVLDDGNDSITIGDWSSILCEELGEAYCSSSQSPCIGAYEYGDINLDGVVNIVDVVNLINILVGTADWGYAGSDDVCSPILADINGDGAINIVDVVLLVNFILSRNPSTDATDSDIIILNNILNLLENSIIEQQTEQFILQRMKRILDRHMAQSNKQTYNDPF